jgi:O-antigen ligase
MTAFRSALFKQFDGWSWYALAFGFALQTSTALTSILSAGVLVWAFSHPRHCLAAWSGLKSEPIFRAMLFLSGAILLGVPVALLHGYSPWAMLGKHLTFLFFFLSLGLFQKPERCRAVFIGFGFGALLALSTSLFSAASGIPFLNVAAPDFNTFRNHTEHNIFLGLAAFGLATLLLRNSGRSWLDWLGWTLIWLAIFDILHLVHGRTGQIVLAALLVIIVAHAVKRRRYIVAAITCSVALLSILPSSPGHQSAVSAGIQAARQDISSYKTGHTETPVGYRIDYFDTTVKLIRERPILGYGTGGFAPAYADFIKIHDPAQQATHNPHNDYLFYWTESGLPGVLAVVFLYLAMAYTTWRSGGTVGLWLLALTVAWAMPGLANSVLLDHASSFVFATMLSALLAGSVYQKPDTSTPQSTGGRCKIKV